MTDVSAPIGVFDSGVGGLTVLRALVRALPHESFLYLGDTARLPYGPKPPAMVRAFAYELTDELIARGVKAIVVACNTASAAALPDLADAVPVPVWGVIEPGVAAALAAHARVGGTGVVGVLGTAGTVASGTYQRALAARGQDAWARACPLFVPIVEEGVSDTAIARLVAEHYLADRPRDLRTLILGCTHYPPLAETLRGVLGPDVALVDSASATAEAVARALRAAGLARGARPGGVRHLVTGDVASYAHVARVLDGP
ncbi:MAG: glutamate racemase, partial [Trueperaceae bacterium]|nr:glutamate racemase [Trueperaceae bacterium]